jgi:hypothetical protein
VKVCNLASSRSRGPSRGTPLGERKAKLQERSARPATWNARGEVADRDVKPEAGGFLLLAADKRFHDQPTVLFRKGSGMQRRLGPICLLCLLGTTTSVVADAGPAGSAATPFARFLVIEHLTGAGSVTNHPPEGMLRGSSFGGSIVIRKRWPGSVRRMDRIRALIFATELQLGLPTGLLDALVAEESGYAARAISRRGAIGLTQLMPPTARSLGVSDPFDALSNVQAGGRYLRDLLRRFGSIALALAAYNAGPEAVVQARGIPPFPETRRHVMRVMARWSTTARGRASARVVPTARADVGSRGLGWPDRRGCGRLQAVV